MKVCHHYSLLATRQTESFGRQCNRQRSGLHTEVFIISVVFSKLWNALSLCLLVFKVEATVPNLSRELRRYYEDAGRRCLMAM